MQKIRFGIVGGGEGSFIGDVHRRSAQLDDLAILTAGCFSRDIDKNIHTARSWHVDDSRVYTDYQQMALQESARADGINFVIIATPNDTHFPIAQCFLNQGIHVSCDKPVAMNFKEALELQELAKKKELHIGVSYTYVNYPMVHQMRDMIDQGIIGNILTVMAEYPQDWVINSIYRGEAVDQVWRFDPKIAGDSAATADIGTHLECLVHHGTGLAVEQVLANLTHIPSHMPLETNAQILCKLTGNIPATLWASQIVFGHECSVSLRVFGDKGALEWCHDNPNRLKFTPADEPEQYLTCGRNFLADPVRRMSRIAYGHPEGFYEAFGTYYKAFCQEISFMGGNGSKPEYSHPTIEDGIRGLLFVNACLKSNAHGNCWVNLNGFN